MQAEVDPDSEKTPMARHASVVERKFVRPLDGRGFD